MMPHTFKVRTRAFLLMICFALPILLGGCSQYVSHAQMPEDVQTLPEIDLLPEGLFDKEGEEEEESLVVPEESKEAEESVEVEYLIIQVTPGEYLKDIFSNLVSLGVAESVEELIEASEKIDRTSLDVFGLPEDEEARELESCRGFLAEGFIAPGEYTFEKGASMEEVLKMLLSSWDDLFDEEMRESAEDQGFSLAEVLTMASIIEYESSKDTTDTVRPEVAAVVRNRLDWEMGLEMDVTVFYLQEALEPYRSADEYEPYYNTYERDSLPAGPINSPSVQSVMAALNPADSDALYFIYDSEGNYYFSEDYETHLYYVEEYLD